MPFALWDASDRGLWRAILWHQAVFSARGRAGLSFAPRPRRRARAGGARLDAQALHLALNFRYLAGERSMFDDIQQLPPGRCWGGKKMAPSRVHDIDVPNPNGLAPLEALRDSVRLHCTADVEVGCYLSGGVDSASIACLARDAGNPALRSFTVAFGDDPQEAGNAARTAELIGIGNLLSDAELSPEQVLPRLIRHLEVPKVNAFQVSCLAKHAARHVKVVLSGLGGDELFYGYEAHGILHRAASLHRLSGGASAWFSRWAVDLFRGVSATPWTEPERAIRMAAAGAHWPRVYGLLRNLWDSVAMRQLVYGPRMLQSDLPDAFDVLESHWPEQADPVRAMTLFEWRTRWSTICCGKKIGRAWRKVLKSECHSWTQDSRRRFSPWPAISCPREGRARRTYGKWSRHCCRGRFWFVRRVAFRWTRRHSSALRFGKLVANG